jgi:hypothetical protein
LRHIATENDPYQGIALAMPLKGVRCNGFSRCGWDRQRLKPSKNCGTVRHA